MLVTGKYLLSHYESVSNLSQANFGNVTLKRTTQHGALRANGAHVSAV